MRNTASYNWYVTFLSLLFQERDFHALVNADGCKSTTSLGQDVFNHLKVVMKETSDICDVSALVQVIGQLLIIGGEGVPY